MEKSWCRQESNREFELRLENEKDVLRTRYTLPRTKAGSKGVTVPYIDSKEARNMNLRFICATCGSRTHRLFHSRLPGRAWDNVLAACCLVPALLPLVWRLVIRPTACPMCAERTLVPLASATGCEVAAKHPYSEANLVYDRLQAHSPSVVAMTIGTVTLFVLGWYVARLHGPGSEKHPVLIDSEVIVCSRADNPCAVTGK